MTQDPGPRTQDGCPGLHKAWKLIDSEDKKPFLLILPNALQRWNWWMLLAGLNSITLQFFEITFFIGLQFWFAFCISVRVLASDFSLLVAFQLLET